MRQAFARSAQIVAALIALAATLSIASADTRFPNGYWRGVNPMRGSSTGAWVSIVSMAVTQLPPRNVRDVRPRFSVALRVRVDGPGVPTVRRAPPPPIQYPRPDQRPAVVTHTQMIEITRETDRLFDDDETAGGKIFQISFNSLARYEIGPGTQCGFFVTIADHGGPAYDAVYYQIIPQRSPCSGGPFEGMALSRGYLVR